MYLSLITIFLLLLLMIITAVQNTLPLDLKFLSWNFQMSITAMIFYSSFVGGAIVALLTLPKLVKTSLHGRRMKKDIHKLKEKILKLEEGHEDDSHSE